MKWKSANNCEVCNGILFFVCFCAACISSIVLGIKHLKLLQSPMVFIIILCVFMHLFNNDDN